MTQAVLSLNADSRTTSPARNSSIFVMSDGALIAIWVEGKNGPGTDRVVRRYRSTDGVTWSRLSDLNLGSLLGTTDPDGSKQIYPVFSQSVTGADTIAAFAIAVPASASYMFVMNYSAIQKDFTADTIIGSYTPTNAWDGLGTGTGTTRSGYTDYAKMLYDSAHTDHILIFDALVAGQEYIYLIAWDTATGKITELRFTNAPNTTCRMPDFGIVTGTPSTIALVYQRTNYAFRTYTYDGATFTAGVGEEVIPGGPTISGGSPRLFLNNNGNWQILYENFTTNPALITRERTGAATYSAAVEIATDLPYGTYLTTVGPEDQFAIRKVGTDDFYVFYKKTTTNFRGELYYVRRNAGTWGAQTPWKTGTNGFNHPSCGAFVVGADHKLHMLYSRGGDVYPGSWTLFYDFLYDGTPSVPTNITPVTRGEISATPTITAKYKNLRAGDSSSKVRVRVLRSSDSTVFWDLGGAGGTAAVVAVDGTYSVLYAGTALVKGTDYYIEINFWDGQESYAGPIGTTVATPFAWNDQPMKVAAALTSDPALGLQRVAMYPYAVPGLVVASVDLYRKLAAAVTYDLRTSIGLTVPINHAGFIAYRQVPEKIGRNLLVNGGFQSGSHGWLQNAATTSVIEDAASPTGYALRMVTEAGGIYPGFYQDVPIEAGKAYSYAAQLRSDGTKQVYIQIDWLDSAGTAITGVVSSFITSTTYVETTLTNLVAPGNARTARCYLVLNGGVGGAGIGFGAALRLMQQTGAPAAWVAAHQRYLSRGLAIYEAGTNLIADGDMENAGVGSWTATNATLTKNTTNPFAGTRRMQVANSAANGRASQTGALAAAQPISASVRCIGADAGAGIRLVSTPGGTTIASDLGASTDWVTRTVSGQIAGGDTGWRVDLIGGSGAAATSQFDNASVENKAYDTMNADLSGQAYALASRTVSQVKLPLPTSFSTADFALVGVVRRDSANPTQAYLAALTDIGAAQTYSVVNFGTTGTGLFKRRNAGGAADLSAAITHAALSPGDTLAWGVRFKEGVGMAAWISINGAAVQSQILTSEESKLAVPLVNPFLYVGNDFGGGGQHQNGTTGILRILKGGVSDATISAIVLDPYQRPTDNDLAVWAFEQFAFQIPTTLDRFTKLGSSYDYRVVSRAAAANPTTITGEATRGSVAASATDAWWLRDGNDPTKDVQLYVRHDTGYEFERGRPLSVATPLQGGPRSVIYGATPFGDEGRLALIYPTAALRDATEAALKALLATNNTTWLQDPFGGLRKVRVSAPITFRPQLTPADLESELSFIEVP